MYIPKEDHLRKDLLVVLLNMWLGPCNWFLVGVAVGLGLQVVGDTSVESRDLDKVGHHPDDGAALRVGDRVENLCDFVRIVDRDGDGM
jgi:hypothetical protein